MLKRKSTEESNQAKRVVLEASDEESDVNADSGDSPSELENKKMKKNVGSNEEEDSHSEDEEADEEGDDDDDADNGIVISDDESFSSEDDEDDQIEDENAQIEMCAFNPEAEDFNGLKLLLNRLFLKEPVNLSELTDLIIQKLSQVASVVRQVDDEAEDSPPAPDADEAENEDDFDQIYAYMALIPLTKNFIEKSPKIVGDLKNWLSDKLEGELKTKLEDDVAFLLHDRFINLPEDLSISLYSSLSDDLNGKTDFESVKNILLYMKVLRDPSDPENWIFRNPEDEDFFSAAKSSFSYSVADQEDGDVCDFANGKNRYQPFRLLAVIDKPEWLKIIQRLNAGE